VREPVGKQIGNKSHLPFPLISISFEVSRNPFPLSQPPLPPGPPRQERDQDNEGEGKGSMELRKKSLRIFLEEERERESREEKIPWR